jgi:hypothetical protein
MAVFLLLPEFLRLIEFAQSQVNGCAGLVLLSLAFLQQYHFVGDDFLWQFRLFHALKYVNLALLLFPFCESPPLISVAWFQCVLPLPCSRGLVKP